MSWKTGRSVVPWFVGGLACVLAFGLAVPPASASFVFNWDTAPGVISYTDTDPNPPGPKPDTLGKDISKVWWGFAGGTHYFRMDLAGVPSAPDSTAQYGIHADFFSGTGDPGYFGVDTLLLGNYNGTTKSLYGWDGSNYSQIDPWAFPYIGFDFQATGSKLEWKIFGDPKVFTWFGITQQDGFTRDISSTVTSTPIPSAAWLFATGVMALFGLKRKSIDAL